MIIEIEMSAAVLISKIVLLSFLELKDSIYYVEAERDIPASKLLGCLLSAKERVR